MPAVTLKMIFEKEHKSVIQYEAMDVAANPKSFLQTVYVRKFALSIPPPHTITLTLEF